MQATELFSQLLQVAIGTRKAVDFQGASAEQWTEILAIARKQGVIAVVFGAIETLPKEKQPPLRNKLQWIGLADVIVNQNEKVSAVCRALDKELAEVGVRSAVLKGQGIATYYPVPKYRNSGDIDLWVQLEKPTDDFEADIKEILKRVESLGKGAPRDPGHHHAEWEVDGISVELHYRPGMFYAKKYDKIYHKMAVEDFPNVRKSEAGFHIPTTYFNLVQMMEHLQRHLLFEGVGLRQLCDYAIVLLQSTEDERTRVRKAIKKLHLSGPASAFMWILQEVFALPKDILLVTPKEKFGRDVLADVMDYGGNMAKMKVRIAKEDFEALSPVGKFIYILKGRKNNFKYAPRETVAEICWQFDIIIKNRRSK